MCDESHALQVPAPRDREEGGLLARAACAPWTPLPRWGERVCLLCGHWDGRGKAG